MFRIWCKCVDDGGHILKEMTVCNDNPDLSRTQKIFSAIDESCISFDLSRPIWLDSNIDTFKKYSRVQFTQDNFIDTFEYAYYEIQVIEED